MTRSTRIVAGVVLALAMVIIGFVAGIYIGGQCCVPADAGLAGGAIVISYGALGSGLGILVALVLAATLPPRWLLGFVLLVALGGTVLGIGLVNVYLKSKAQSAAHMQQAYENMNTFRLQLTPAEAMPNPPFAEMAFDWQQRSYQVTDKQQVCHRELTGPQGAQVLKSLRAVDGVTYQDPFPCAGTLGDVLYQMEFFIDEATADDTQGKLAVTAACLQQYPALGEPMEVAREIYRAQGNCS